MPANPHAKLSAALFQAATLAQCPGVLDAPASDSIWAHPAIKACQRMKWSSTCISSMRWTGGSRAPLCLLATQVDLGALLAFDSTHTTLSCSRLRCPRKWLQLMLC
eukprot:3955387-Amphidinium_carterae.1